MLTESSVSTVLVDDQLSFAQIASIPVGYNNPRLVKAAQSPEMIRALVNRPALGSFPPTDWLETLRQGILKAAPPGFDQVFTSMNGSDANESAYKAACIWKAQMDRGGPGVDFTPEEIESAMLNKAPGSPNYSILSFKGGFHGRLFGSLATTRSKPIHKLDIPAFDWPCAPFPKLRYPLEDNIRANAEEEARCLEETERLITSFHNPVAAVVVEPIQSEGGDNHASPAFFQCLREMTLRHNVIFIVDEVQTGKRNIRDKSKKLIPTCLQVWELPASCGPMSIGTSARLPTLSPFRKRPRQQATSSATPP